MATRIHLTGRLAIEHAGQLILDEGAFPLAADAHRSLPRGELTEVLWGDSPPREAGIPR